MEISGERLWIRNAHEDVSCVAAVPGLRALMLIRGLQREAQRALGEAGHLLHPGDASRLSRVLLAASSIQSVSRRLVSQLLLKPVIDHADVLRSLTETLVCSDKLFDCGFL